MKAFHALLTAVVMLFFAIMLIFRLVDGSFQSPGARMDRMLGAAAGEVATATDFAVQDIAEDFANRRD